jgi:DME family drug/metabolite transporter
VRPNLAGTLLIVTAAALFGTASYISRSAEALGLGSFGLVFWRAALGGLVLGAAVGGTGLAGRARVVMPGDIPSDARRALATAAVVNAVLNLALFTAFNRMSIAVALIVFYSFPAIVTLAAVRFYGEHLDGRRLGALALASGGLVLVLLAPAIESGGLTVDPLGIALAALAALCQVVYVLVSGRGFSMVPAAQAVSLFFLFGAAVAAPAAIVALGTAGAFAPLATPELWRWVIAAGVLTAAIPSLCMLAGMRIIGPSRTAILMTLEPVVGVAMAAALLGERPVPLQLAGGVAVLAAGALLQLGPRSGGAAARWSPSDPSVAAEADAAAAGEVA